MKIRAMIRSLLSTTASPEPEPGEELTDQEWCEKRAAEWNMPAGPVPPMALERWHWQYPEGWADAQRKLNIGGH